MPAPPARRSRFGHPSVTLAVALLVLLGVVASCSHTDGRTLAEPDPNLTLTSPPTTAAPTTLVPFLSVKSSAVEAGGVLPERFTCDGADVSPPLAFGDVPADAASLAISLTDPDAGGFVHWAVTGIDPTSTSLTVDEVPPGAVVYPNDFGDARYNGPCPPDGDLHNYTFTVYAVPTAAVELVGPDETNGAGVIDAVSRLASASADLTVQYGDAG